MKAGHHATAGSAAVPAFRWRLTGYAREQSQGFPEDLLAGYWVWKLLRHRLAAAPAAIPVPADARGHCQVGQDAVSASRGGIEAGREARRSPSEVVIEKQPHTAVFTQSAPAVHSHKVP